MGKNKTGTRRARRWYAFPDFDDVVRVQWDRSAVSIRREACTVPRPIFDLAYEEYAKQGHGGQYSERLLERGGFSQGEIIALLADALDRIKKKETNC